MLLFLLLLSYFWGYDYLTTCNRNGESCRGSVLVYRFTKTDTKDPTMFNS